MEENRNPSSEGQLFHTAFRGFSRADVVSYIERLTAQHRQEREDAALRITFDRNIRWRQSMLDLREGDEGEPLLDEGQVLMEIKLPEAAPLWLARMLSELKLFPVSFSKYGSCYKRHILDDYIKEVVLHV